MIGQGSGVRVTVMSSAEESVRKLIQQYFIQLTQGCGHEACSNVDCATGRGRPMNPTDAATTALALATNHSKSVSKCCVSSFLSNTSTSSSCALSKPGGEPSLLRNISPKQQETVTVSITDCLPSDPKTRCGRPEACPISSLDAALNWMPGHDDLCVPSIPLSHCMQSVSDPSLPRMIICHDMMGGYKKDRYVQGHSELEDYYFYHWRYVEAFIYFSHHFLSIPPPGWTNAAHRNGRLSMGTMITEWKDGAKLCARLLSSEDTLMLLAHQMIKLAQYYRFDGWLVNIENPINPMLMDRLYMFLSLLTTGMHETCPGSKIIWYDSVTVDGNLKWQNSLNRMNQPFFDLCDGIFLNYGWKMPLLQASGALAAHRRGDVYVGVDVFGRGCYGGGGFNTNKAMAVIKQAGLSSAIFAPGWVYENQPKSHFFENQDRFWSLLDSYCPSGQPYSLPVVSSFGRGCGEMLCVDGTIVQHGHWSNLSAQDLQPSFFSSTMLKNHPKSGVYLDKAEIDTSVAYNGGSSLKLTGRLMPVSSNLPATARLFQTAIEVAPLLVSYTVQEEDMYTSVSHYLQLQTKGSVVLLDPSNRCTGKGVVYDLPMSGELPLPTDWPSTAVHRLGALSPPHSDILHQIFTGSKQPTGKWRTEYFIISQKYLKGPVKTIGLAVMPSISTSVSQPQDFALNLGEVKILDVKCISSEERPSYIRNLHCMDVDVSIENTVSLTIKWDISNNPADPITHCNVYATSLLGEPVGKAVSWKGDCIYIGVAYANCFRVCGMHMLSNDLKEQPFGVEFRLQSVTLARRKPSVNSADSITVWFYP